MLLLSTWQKSGCVLKEDHRNVVEVAKPNKAGVFISRIDIDLTRGHRRVVRNETHHVTAHPAKGRHGVAGAIGLRLQKIAMITELLDQDADIEGSVEPGRRVKRLFKQNINVHGLAVRRIRGLPVRRQRLI